MTGQQDISRRQALAGGVAAVGALGLAPVIASASSPGAAMLPLAAYVGRYDDPRHGDISVSLRGSCLFVDFRALPGRRSPLEVVAPGAFRTRFAGGGDVLIGFATDRHRAVRLSTRRLPPSTA